jgi:transposase
MLSLSTATRVFVALEPVDMRKSFNGLHARVQTVLQQDPLSGHLFVFTNRLHNRLKILFWDGSGLWVCAKRLERGRFSWPQSQGACVPLRTQELAALLTGLEVRAKSNWYRA